MYQVTSILEFWSI